MHEMSIAMSLLELAEAEIKKRGCDKISRLKVQCGALSGVAPDALDLCFRALADSSPHKNAVLEIELVPTRLRCPFCETIFSGDDADALFRPCPACGAEFGHIVEAGKELILLRVEAERAAPE